MVNDPTQPTANRLVFLSEPLEEDLRISGTPAVELTASSSLDEAYFGAILVDYGSKTRISRTSDGIISDPSGEEDCWGESSATDDACYRVTTTLTTQADLWRVSKGILDGRNRNSPAIAEPLVPGVPYEIGFPLLPNDYVFPAGNRIGVVLVGSYRSYGAERLPSRPTITVDAKVSHVALPIVGGQQAARRAGIPLRQPGVVLAARLRYGRPEMPERATDRRREPGRTPASSSPRRHNVNPVLGLQSAIGNRAVAQMLARAPVTTGSVQIGAVGAIKVKGGNLEEWTGKGAPDTVDVTSDKGKHSAKLEKLANARTRTDVKVTIAAANEAGEALNVGGGTMLEITDARIKGYAVEDGVETWRVADFEQVKRTKITRRVS